MQIATQQGAAYIVAYGVGQLYKVATLVLLIALGSSVMSSIALAESFDKPVRRVVVDLGRSRYQPDVSRIKLSCFYYPNFMVKELFDPGMKGGVQWVTTTPTPKGHPTSCRPPHGSTERFIETEYWWSFQGVKGSLLFLQAGDGDNNAGMPFRVVDWKTGRKIFEDSGQTVDHFHFGHTSDGQLSIRYLRRVGDDCSIPKSGMNCWNKFREKFRLPVATAPKCMGYRQEGKRKWAPGDEGMPPEEVDLPSVIDYPVVLILFPLPSIKAVPGPVSCYPTE